MCETTNRDRGLASAGSTPANDAPGTSGGTPEEDSPAPPGGVNPPVPVNDASSLGSSPGPAPPLGPSPAGSAPSGTVPQGGSVRGRGSSRGGRGSAPSLQSPGLLREVDLRGRHHAARWTWQRVCTWTWYSWWTRFHLDACNYQVCFERTHCKYHPGASSPLLRVCREGEFPTSPTGTAHSASRNTRTLWEQRNRMFHGQSRNGGARPKPLSGTQQQNARLRVLKIVKFTSLFRALQFPLDGSESIRNGCSSARRTAPLRLV